MTRRGHWFVFAVAWALSACANSSLPYKRLGRGEEAVRWVLVEKRYRDLPPAARSGQGRIGPDSPLLMYVAVEEPPVHVLEIGTKQVDSPPEGLFVELLAVSPSGTVRLGEVVTAKVRVGRADQLSYYRLLARPVQRELEVLGKSEVLLRGGEPVEFRFGSNFEGRFGFEVQLQLVR